MANIQTKASVFALVEETTEGTPVAPSAATQYIALQDDAEMTPGAETLENAEFKNSIGISKPIKGSENPTGSMSHYLRASGVEAQAPGFGPFLKAFFGSEATRATERDTVAGSTTAVLNVDAGEGTEFAKNHFTLIKDGVNGYRVRAIESVATDALTMGFNLPNAPASGVDLGRDVRYLPAQSDHISLSLWHYLGNGGATQLISGGKVTEFSFDATAGELVNASYSFEGLEYFFNPIQIGATNKYIDFDDGGGEENVSVTEDTYKNPIQLADAIAAAMNAATTDVITCTYSSSTGKFTIASDGITLSLLWNTGTNTANTIGGSIGFSVAADDTGATSYDGDSAIDLSAQHAPSYDSSDPLAAKGHEVMVGESDDYACFNASTIAFSGSNTRTVNGDICAESGQGSANITEREITVEISALLEKYEAEQMNRFDQNSEVKFQYTFGTKSGGNWVAGKVGAVYIGTATISEITIDDADGLSQLNMTLSAFVNDEGEGEAAIGFLCKDFTQQVDVKNKAGEPEFSGSFVVAVPSRNERLPYQMEMQKIKSDEDNAERYLKFSNDVLQKHLKSIDVLHHPTETKITSVEDFEYYSLERLIAEVLRPCIDGPKLGNKNA